MKPISQLSRAQRYQRLRQSAATPGGGAVALDHVPDPPKHLNATARRIWKEALPRLVERGVVDALALPLFGRYCAARAMLDDDPNMSTRDFVSLSGAMLRIERELGLTPRARGVKAPAPVDALDPDDDDDESDINVV